jgi:hypothetical protein
MASLYRVAGHRALGVRTVPPISVNVSLDGQVGGLLEDQPHMFCAVKVSKHLLRSMEVLNAGFFNVLQEFADSVGNAQTVEHSEIVQRAN